MVEGDNGILPESDSSEGKFKLPEGLSFSNEEIKYIKLPEPVSAEERPDESFEEEHKSYLVSRSLAVPNVEPVPLSEYARFARSIVLPQQKYTVKWKEEHPGYTPEEWNGMFNEIVIDLRARIILGGFIGYLSEGERSVIFRS